MRSNGNRLDPYARARERMIELLASRGISDARVLEAMRRIPRHEFVPEPFTSRSYGDHALSIGADQTISQPYMVALMSQLLELTPESRVLEIGAGSGYQTAALAMMAKYVYAIERIASLSRDAMARLRALRITNATIKCFDGTIGWSEHAPYDAILVAAAAREVPVPLAAQLADGGRLVIPLGDPGGQELVRLIRRGDSFTRASFGPVRFVAFMGDYGDRQIGRASCRERV